MPRDKKRFTLVKISENDSIYYAIFDNGEIETILSQWIACKSIRKLSTGKE